ncbi:MAG: nicotinate (nicotinamide) nucleotide adenylyltransferase, partial [Actinomycetota bacterium]|nr:nicotinate (nicotinamide) nucleotide adenylyltransferase [Actinomycetota bacterium]
MRLGVLGGAFNPPHIGHLVLAQEAVARLSLDRVLLVPVGEPVHREIEQDPGAEVRLHLCELATAGDDRLEASRAELDRGGPSYTVDTLRALREGAPDDELVLLLGGDQAAALDRWREPEEILRLATVAWVERGEARREEVGRALARLEGGERAVVFAM